MGEVVSYVNTDNVGSEDGLTPATGWKTLATWHTNEQTDLVTDGDNHTVYCSGVTADTASLQMTSGWTTDSTHTLDIIGDNTTGKWNTSAYRIEFATGGNNQEGITVSNFGGYVTLKNLQVQMTVTSTHTGDFGIQLAGPGVLADGCIVKGVHSGSGSSHYGLYIANGGSGDNSKAQNCLVYDVRNGAGTTYRGFYGAGATDSAKFYNCTSINNGIGFNGSSGDSNCYNCVAQDCITDYSSIATPSSNNLSSDTTAPGTSPQTEKTLTFANKGADDYHLDSGDSDAIGNGIGPSSDSEVPALDIDGDTRSGTTTDIGFDLFTSSGSIIPQIMHHYQNNT